MTGFVFILFYYLSRPLFINFGLGDRLRFFVALTLGLLFETTIYLITGNTGYKLIAWLRVCLMKYEGAEIIQKYIMSGDTSFAFKLNFFYTDFVLNVAYVN